MINKVRVATYNIAWFNNLFDSNNKPRMNDETASELYKVTKKKQLESIALTLKEIDPDVLCINEAPSNEKARSTVAALEAFAAEYGLRTTKALVGFTGWSMNIAILYDPDKAEIIHDPKGIELSELENDELMSYLKSPGRMDIKFSGLFVCDSENDGINEIHKFTRPPLEAHVKFKNSLDLELEMIAAHTKSKAIFEPFEEIQFEQRSMANRKKLFIECQWIRKRVDKLLHNNKHVIVLGDFNDGPGLDFYEKQFGRSAVEIIMGDLAKPDEILRFPYSKPKWNKSRGWSPASASFYQKKTGKYMHVLIDYILASKSICDTYTTEWKIWNPYQQKEFKDMDFLKSASDHFPVTLDIFEKQE